jgi:hypothetical protein
MEDQEVSENNVEIRMQNVIVQNNTIISIDEDKIKEEELPGDVQSTTEGGESTAEATSTE